MSSMSISLHLHHIYTIVTLNLAITSSVTLYQLSFGDIISSWIFNLPLKKIYDPVPPLDFQNFYLMTFSNSTMHLI